MKPKKHCYHTCPGQMSNIIKALLWLLVTDVTFDILNVKLSHPNIWSYSWINGKSQKVNSLIKTKVNNKHCYEGFKNGFYFSLWTNNMPVTFDRGFLPKSQVHHGRLHKNIVVFFTGIVTGECKFSLFILNNS